MSWTIDYAHSQIEFSVRHLMVSRVRGRFEKFQGNIHVDEEHPENSTVYVEIDAASINTGQPDRDAHLRSPDFLDVENHPHLIFRSKRLQVLDDSHGKLIGDLTIRGVTREVVLDVTYHGQVKSPFGPFVSAGFSAQTKINRKDWGLTWNAVLETGGVVVGDEVEISIELELMKSLEEAPAAATA
ncbi:MAG: polyisoprenoid-binding protein [Litorilinea sp.]|nr:MAG: polyisoprenoid-binding protein [Litorilinea sp.]